MCKIQASAKIKIPYGMLDEFKQAATDYIKQVKEKIEELFKVTGFLAVIRLSVKSERYLKAPKLP